ncbi:MAG: 30S ribosomal protein S4 [bacterium]|nr:30S ribosomal protein S4 [bacterium]
MGRYLGPKHRICRRAGEKLCDADRCPTQRRPYPPGVHGPRLRKKVTEYGTQLFEKQKARMVYGIMERQLRRYYEDALRSEGNTAEFLAERLERRVDNVVFRLGLAKTRSGARQLVTHGHMTLNGAKHTVPSALVKVGDVIGVRAGSMTHPSVAQYAQTAAAQTIPAWLAADGAATQGRVLRLPTLADAPQSFRMQSIIEFYSR